MSEVNLPRQTDPRDLLQLVIEEQIPAIMSYLSRGKWHVAKIQLNKLGATRLNAEIISDTRPQPINIQIEQPVGVSLKYRYGKVIFDVAVLGFELPTDNSGKGQIILSVPNRVEIIQRRSYFRVSVPKSLKVNVAFWRRYHKSPDKQIIPNKYWKGSLVDISAGGLQIMVDNTYQPDFKKGQFVVLRFTPLPYEMPLMFSAQIRNCLETADGKGQCLGMQVVGLEASPEGQNTLQRLCGVVEQYYQLNQSNAKQRDFQVTR